MREIKFRAYDCLVSGGSRLKEMVYFNLFDSDEDMLLVGRGYGIWVDDNATIMQYTGLKDKNGKEIYEGDIAIYHDGMDEYPEIIRWNNGNACFDYSSNSLWEYRSRWLEIIGNIYENPGLLEENKK